MNTAKEEEGTRKQQTWEYFTASLGSALISTYGWAKPNCLPTQFMTRKSQPTESTRDHWVPQEAAFF